MARFILTGDKALDATFATFEPKLQKKIARKAARKAAEPLKQKVIATAPEDEGDYKKTIKIKALKRSRKWKHSVGVRVITDPKWIEKLTSDIPGLFNPHWAEFGTSKQAPQPHWRPAMRSTAAQVQSIFKANITPLINEIARERLRG